MTRMPIPQSSVEEILRAGLPQQRTFVREAMYAADTVLPKNLAKMVKMELDSSINLLDWMGASPLVLHAAAEVLAMARDRSPDQGSDTA